MARKEAHGRGGHRWMKVGVREAVKLNLLSAELEQRKGNISSPSRNLTWVSVSTVRDCGDDH